MHDEDQANGATAMAAMIGAGSVTRSQTLSSLGVSFPLSYAEPLAKAAVERAHLALNKAAGSFWGTEARSRRPTLEQFKVLLDLPEAGFTAVINGVRVVGFGVEAAPGHPFCFLPGSKARA